MFPGRFERNGLYPQVEFSPFLRKRCLIRIAHALRASPITFIPCEEHFRPVLPTIEGNVDYLALGGQVGALSFDGQEDVFDLVRIAITFADTPNSDPLTGC